jgi:hypothetical protein
MAVNCIKIGLAAPLRIITEVFVQAVKFLIKWYTELHFFCCWLKKNSTLFGYMPNGVRSTILCSRLLQVVIFPLYVHTFNDLLCCFNCIFLVQPRRQMQPLICMRNNHSVSALCRVKRCEE